ncbi:hypothetical protein PAPYR_2705 [Paratrimastix pyriformis]|uniref:UNC93-like protein MFSD11 n=1 Tax=Paratrimastix pyriformis TaxID=342808 RepID=A0ABQ8UNY1_9EUKA|nr:hypothetical protein PAPYR_2705 [Paratrimastix pyriformis]
MSEKSVRNEEQSRDLLDPCALPYFFSRRGSVTFSLGMRFPPILKSVWLGAGFMLIFCAQMSAENIMTALYSDFGFVCMAIVYFSFAAASLCAPPVAKKIGPRVSMFIGSITYVAFCAGSIFSDYLTKQVALIIVSAALGLGASIMWSGQGKYIVAICPNPSLLGRYTGVFFCIFSFSNVLGNLIMTILRGQLKNDQLSFIVLSIIGCVGIVLFAFMPSMNPSPASSSSRPEGQHVPASSASSTTPLMNSMSTPASPPPARREHGTESIVVAMHGRPRRTDPHPDPATSDVPVSVAVTTPSAVPDAAQSAAPEATPSTAPDAALPAAPLAAPLEGVQAPAAPVLEDAATSAAPADAATSAAPADAATSAAPADAATSAAPADAATSAAPADAHPLEIAPSPSPVDSVDGLEPVRPHTPIADATTPATVEAPSPASPAGASLASTLLPDVQPAPEPEPKSCCTRFWTAMGDFFLPVIRIVLTKPYLLLLPTIMSLGLTASFWGGVLPPKAPTEHQSTLFIVRGAIYVLTSLVIGRLSDLTGRLFMCTLMHVAGLIGSLIGFLAVRNSVSIAMLYIAFVFFGFFEGCLGTQVFAIIGFVYPTRSDVGVAAYSFIRALIAGIFYLIATYLSIDAHFIIFEVMCFVALLCLYVLHYCVHPLDVKAQKKRAEAAAQKAAPTAQKPLLLATSAAPSATITPAKSPEPLERSMSPPLPAHVELRDVRPTTEA